MAHLSCEGVHKSSAALTHMVFFVIKLLNHFPVKGGVSTQYSPETTMSGQTINYRQYSSPRGGWTTQQSCRENTGSTFIGALIEQAGRAIVLFTHHRLSDLESIVDRYLYATIVHHQSQ